jgi:hypothetical protein
MSKEKPVSVIIDHDGGVEDLVAVMLLMLDPRVKLLMVSYLEAGECAPLQLLMNPWPSPFWPPTVSCFFKLLFNFHRSCREINVPVPSCPAALAMQTMCSLALHA